MFVPLASYRRKQLLNADWKPTRYGLAAIKAATFATDGGMSPEHAWQIAAGEVFPDSLASQVKACPKSAFLGLAEAGHIAGISPGRYTKSVDNRRYAEAALKILQQNAALAENANELWRMVMNGQVKKHNSQMDVVIALWNAKKFAAQHSNRFA
jgi:hypothetical protein